MSQEGGLSQRLPMNDKSFPLSQLSARSSDRNRLMLEFQDLTRFSSTADYRRLMFQPNPIQAIKNRYCDIIPHDHSRVKLIVAHDDESDYINANFCNLGLHGSEHNCYISTQAPVAESIGDFWTMIWQQKSSIVVMLTDLRDGNREKATQYWPELNQSLELGDLKVTTIVDQVDQNHLRMRILQLHSLSEDQDIEVMQLQYISWPDHGVPEEQLHEIDHMFERYRHFRNLQPDGHSTVIHCSAGIGRTGTFLAIDLLLSYVESLSQQDVEPTLLSSSSEPSLSSSIEAVSSADPASTAAASAITVNSTASSSESTSTLKSSSDNWRDNVIINVYDLVKALRLQRPFMVQTFVQYEFIHKYLLHILNNPDQNLIQLPH